MIRKYLSILLILFCYCSAQSQISSSSITSGTDFWLTYRDDWLKDSTMTSMQIRIVTESAMAQGQITFTSINDMFKSIYIRCKSSNNNSICSILIKYIIQSIGKRITQKWIDELCVVREILNRDSLCLRRNRCSRERIYSTAA